MIIFEEGQINLLLPTSSSAERATIACVTGTNFAPFRVVHPLASVDGEFEVALDFGDASRHSAARWAMEYLNEVAGTRDGITAEIPTMPDGPPPENPWPQPYVDFGVGATIWVPAGVADGLVGYRVTGIGSSVSAQNPDSVVRWELQLGQPSADMEERLSSLMRRQMPGSAGGRTILPSPTEPTFPAQEAGREQVETWQWDYDGGSS